MPRQALLGETGPLQAEREGADVCTYRDLAHRVLYTARASRRRDSDRPAKGPDAAADRTGLGEGERRSLDWVRVPVRVMRASERRVPC